MAADASPTRLRWLLPPIAAPLLLFWQGVVGRLVLAPGDGFQYYLPLHVLTARIWRDGEVPGWNPFQFSGAPLLATNQVAAFFPPNALFLVLSPVMANNLVVVLNFLVAGVGAALLSRRLVNDGPAMAVTGIAFGLCGFMVAHVGHQSMIASISWLPWTLLGFELLLERVSPLRLLFGAGSLALALAAGHGQMFFQIVLALGVYAVAMSGADRTPRMRAVLVASLMVVVGVALAGVQMLPTASILDATDRSRISFATATEYSLSPSHGILLMFPYVFGNATPWGPYTEPYGGLWNLTELMGYAGLSALVLAAVAVFARGRDRRVRALVAIGAVALVIALGDTTPLARLVYRVPIYGQFRNWGRYLATLDLAIAVLAGYGVAAIRSAEDGARRRMLVVGAVAVGFAAFVGLVLPRLGPVARYAADGRTASYAIAVPLACAVAALACLIAMRRWRRIATAGLVAVVAADLALAFGVGYEWRTRAPFREVVEDDMASPARSHVALGPITDAPGGLDRYFFTGLDISAVPSVGRLDVRGYRSVNGFDPLAPDDYMRAAGDMVYYGGVRDPNAALHPSSWLLDVLRVSVVLFDPRHDPFAKRAPPPGQRIVAEPGQPIEGTPALRYEYRPRLPDAYLVGAARRVPRHVAVNALWGRQPFDPTQTTLVDGGCAACHGLQRPGPAGTVRSVRWGTASFDAVVAADRPALLNVSQAWFPGWRATIDGESVPVLRANAVAQAVPVPAGTHRIHLSYRPPGLWLGAFLTTAALVGLLGWAAVERLTRR